MDEQDYIKSALNGLLANPNIVRGGKTVNIKKVVKLAHRIGSAQYKRVNNE